MSKHQYLALVLLFALSNLGLAYAQTVVDQDVATSAVWTTSGSPYLIQDNIRIFGNASLTIEPGVEIRGTNFEILVDGAIEAIGTAEDSIHFVGDGSNINFKIAFMANSTGDFRFVDVAEEAGIQVRGATANLNIARSSFRNSSVGIAGLSNNLGANGQVNACAFINNGRGAQTNELNYTDCSFSRNMYGVNLIGGRIDNCSFSKNGVGVRDSDGAVRNSTFFLNQVAFELSGQDVTDTIVGNEILLNDIAFSSWGINGFVKENTICNNAFAVVQNTNQDADLSDNCWCTSDPNAIDALILDSKDDPAFGTVTFLPLGNCSFGDIVWPGDADNNGFVEIYDVLQVGLSQNAQGPGRPSATQIWQPQIGSLWGSNIAGIDHVFSDCNGDGQIDGNDLAPIAANFGETQQKRNGLATDGIPLCLDYPDSVNAGESVFVGVYLGDSLIPVPNAYGMALVLQYDDQIVDTTQVQIASTSGWMGSPGQNLLSFGIQQQNFHWAITRDDNVDTTGFGLVGGVEMVMIDDLAKTEPLTITVLDAFLIDAQGNLIPVTLTECSQKTLARGLNVYPNPVTDRIQIEWGDYEATEVAIYSMDGRQVYRNTDLGNSLEFSTEGLREGMFIVQVRLTNGLLSRKILIIK